MRGSSERWTYVGLVIVVVLVAALCASGPAVTCAQGECSCPTVTAQAAVIEHQATVMARLWNDSVACRATLEAIRAPRAGTPAAMPLVLR